MIPPEILAKCTTPSEQETAIFFASLGLKCIDLSYKAYATNGRDVIGEADGIFLDLENELIIVYDDSKKNNRVNDKITKFFTKWTHADIETQIFNSFVDLPSFKIYILYIDKTKNAKDATIHSIKHVLKPNTIILRKDDFEYFKHLSESLGKWAKNDLYNFIGAEPTQLRTEFEATQIYVGNTPAFLFADRADRLLQYCYVSRRRGNDEGYQRMVDLRRIKEIGDSLKTGTIDTFPNSILINCIDGADAVTIHPKSKCPIPVKLTIPRNFSSCRVVDGQHRLLSFTQVSLALQTKFSLPVVMLKNMTREEEIRLFLDINNNAKKVDKNLEYELLAQLEWPAGDENDLIKIATNILARLEKNDPLNGKIYRGLVGQTKKDKITLIAFVDSLIRNRLISQEGGFLQLAGNNNDSETPYQVIQATLIEISKLKRKLEYFFSNRGIELLFTFIKSSVDEPASTKVDDLKNAIVPKLDKLTKRTSEEFERISKLQGATSAKEALAIINEVES